MATYRGFRQLSKYLHSFKRPLLYPNRLRNVHAAHLCTIATSEIGEQIERSAGVFASELKLWCGENRVELNGIASEPLLYYYQWLRFHCRCEKCFNHKTQQRTLTILDIEQYPKPKECYLEDNKMVAIWQDGHVSRFELQWLAKNSYDVYLARSAEIAKHRQLWQGQQSVVARVPFRDLIQNRSARKKVLKSLLEYGVAFVDEVNPTKKATEDAVRALAPVQQTFFGGMWEFGIPDEETQDSHLDTAYTNEALGPHTDNSYFTESSGLQVFHCLSAASSGGATKLVDGFAAAERLKLSQPAAFDMLASTVVPFRYDEPGHIMASLAPVFTLHPLTQDLQQIRFNPYDLASLATMSQMSAVRWLKSWRCLSEEIACESAPWYISLRPGSVLFIDNWRVLHGREEFQGRRHMTGCYITRSDFLSAARVSGALESDD